MQLFEISSPMSHDIALCTKDVMPRVTKEMNERLNKEYTKEEVT